MTKADSYSSLERRFLDPVRGLGLRVNLPIVRLLARLGISPHAVSLSGPLFGLAFVLIVPHNPRLSFLVWLVSMWVDNLDGSLARYTGRASDFGALMDQVADHLREIMILAGLASAGALHPLWGSLYPFVYTELNVILFITNYYAVPIPLALKSWPLLYPVIAVYLLWDINYLDYAVGLCVLLMSVTIAHGLCLLSRAMHSQPKADR
ncbi:MAG TPA: CDP-alcohol phosphatidyltransferase family protein [Anaerolineae bacterium]|nr:CDP-alcohol phosphatidyltransferase family protein [Anaerolineae bacterium]